MAQLGRSIDELGINGFQMGSRSGRSHGFSQKNESLLGTNTAALDEKEVISDNTIVREATHGGDVLFCQISVSGGVVLGSTSLTLTDSVYFLVELGSVIVSELTSSGDGPGNTRRMPGTDTSDFSVTSVGFLLEMADTPSFHNTSKSFTLSDTNDVNKLVLREDTINSDFLFEEGVNEGNLISGGLSSIDLNFENVVLFLSEVFQEVVLSVDNGSNDGAVFSDSVELDFNFLGVL